MRQCRTCTVDYDEEARIGPLRSFCQTCFDIKIASWPASAQRYYAAREPDATPWHLQTFHRMNRKITIDQRITWPAHILPFRRGTETKIIDLGYKLLKNGGSVIDAGANFGELTAHWSPLADYVAFEPIPAYWDLIERNANQNKGRVSLYRHALSDVTAQTKMSWSPASGDQAHITADGSIVACTRRLDDLNLNPPTLLKIDTEGHELPILRGGRKMLEQHHPHLILEVNPRWAARYNYTIDELLTFLLSVGYRDILTLKGEPYVGQKVDDIWVKGVA